MPIIDIPTQEKAYRRQIFTHRAEMCEELDRKVKQLPPDAMKYVRDTVRKKSRLSSYDLNSKMYDPSIAPPVMRSRFEVVCLMHNRISSLRADVLSDTYNENVSCLQRHSGDSKSSFKKEAQDIRPSVSVMLQDGIHMGASTVDSVSGTEKNVMIKARISPAWCRLIRKLGGASIRGQYLIVNAMKVSHPFYGATIYYGELINLKGDPKAICGYFGIYMNNNTRISVHGDCLAKTERMLRSHVARAVSQEMTE